MENNRKGRNQTKSTQTPVRPAPSSSSASQAFEGVIEGSKGHQLAKAPPSGSHFFSFTLRLKYLLFPFVSLCILNLARTFVFVAIARDSLRARGSSRPGLSVSCMRLLGRSVGWKADLIYFRPWFYWLGQGLALAYMHTYARTHAVCLIWGAATGDDDGEYEKREDRPAWEAERMGGCQC